MRGNDVERMSFLLLFWQNSWPVETGVLDRILEFTNNQDFLSTFIYLCHLYSSSHSTPQCHTARIHIGWEGYWMISRMLFLSRDMRPIVVVWGSNIGKKYLVVLCLSVISWAEPILESSPWDPRRSNAVTFQPKHQVTGYPPPNVTGNTGNTRPITQLCSPI